MWRRNAGTPQVSVYQSIDDLFKCRPSILYPIFVNQWSGTVNDDKLLIGSVNTCVAVQEHLCKILEVEASKHRYVEFITNTYDDLHLPYIDTSFM